MTHFISWRPILKILSRELLITILLLLGVSIIIFSILHMAPGDPLHIFINIQTQNPDEIAAIKRSSVLTDGSPFNTSHGSITSFMAILEIPLEQAGLYLMS